MPSLRTLNPRFRPFAEQLYQYARRLDPRFTVTSARRSRTEQQRLYAKYLKGQSPFTALPPGKSQHEKGLAVDLVRLNNDPATDPVLAQLGREWRAAGGVWGGESDPVHFEAPRSWTGRRA